MEIIFRTKAESNLEQEKEFLSLTPIERFYRFLEMSERLKDFPVKKEDKDENKGNNFLIEIKLS
ncbi:MAG: hypothetical protein CMH48_02070 [Muricauda sp.]|nr:hypothetical protein [Allomuricauda sp.]MAU26859.1 hypothetical protein [Allomuricauda sp.]MBC29606.1 hypothetical protein [Allomuricauda sp.]|tara:strand:- start:18470 stop:18661 length:192 start_codon:yes stop_codon:yes gene_type:complete